MKCSKQRQLSTEYRQIDIVGRGAFGTFFEIILLFEIQKFSGGYYCHTKKLWSRCRYKTSPSIRSYMWVLTKGHLLQFTTVHQKIVKWTGSLRWIMSGCLRLLSVSKRFFDLTLIPHFIIFIYSLTSAAILHTKRLVEHLRKESSASSVRGTAIIRVVANWVSMINLS